VNRIFAVALTFLLALAAVWAVAAWDLKEIENTDTKVREAGRAMPGDDLSVQRFFDSAAAYVVIPTVGKAGIGGARGTSGAATTSAAIPRHDRAKVRGTQRGS
jgi:hypothetical protein